MNAMASATLHLPNPNPNPNPRSILSFDRTHPSSLRFQPLPHRQAPLQIVHHRHRNLIVSSAALAPPSFVPTSAITSILNLAARITAAAARAAPSPERIAAIRAVLYAAVSNPQPAGECFKTPLLAVASGAASWIGLYAEVLSLRCILTWFPNIPWDRQPFSALRDLCDPYLVLFRHIVPPLNGFDLSPILAFWVLGILSSLLNSNLAGH